MTGALVPLPDGTMPIGADWIAHWFQPCHHTVRQAADPCPLDHVHGNNCTPTHHRMVEIMDAGRKAAVRQGPEVRRTRPDGSKAPSPETVNFVEPEVLAAREAAAQAQTDQVVDQVEPRADGVTAASTAPVDPATALPVQPPVLAEKPKPLMYHGTVPQGRKSPLDDPHRPDGFLVLPGGDPTKAEWLVSPDSNGLIAPKVNIYDVVWPMNTITPCYKLRFRAGRVIKKVTVERQVGEMKMRQRQQAQGVRDNRPKPTRRSQAAQ